MAGDDPVTTRDYSASFYGFGTPLKGLQGPPGTPGERGEQGPQGIPGPGPTTSQLNEAASLALALNPPKQGERGNAATIKIGNVSTGDAGTLATVTNVGTENDAVFAFALPRGYQGIQGEQGVKGDQGVQGIQGPSGTLAIRNVSKGDTPSVTNVGTPQAAVFDIVLPKGDKGDQGIQGVKGDKGDSADASTLQGLPATAFVRQADTGGNQTVNGWTLQPKSGAIKTEWNRLLTVNGDGGSEVGSYLDFHSDSSGSEDFDARLSADNTGWMYSSGNLQANGGTVKAAGQDGSLSAYSAASNVTVRLISQEDGNVVLYRTDSSGNARAVWSINNNDGPLQVNVPTQAPQYRFSSDTYWSWDGSAAALTTLGGYKAIFNSQGNVDFYCSTGRVFCNGHELMNTGTDGAGSGYDADMLDGFHASAFVRLIGDDAQVPGTFTATRVLASSNGDGYALKIGDDAWLGDVNIANTVNIKGEADGSQGYLQFGGNGRRLGNTGNQTGLWYDGDFTAAGNITAFSDRRLKSRIIRVRDALATVQKLAGVTYDKDGRRHIGLIAQNVQKHVPEAVHEGAEYLSVNYGGLTGLLVEAIRDLSNEVAAIKEQLA